MKIHNIHVGLNEALCSGALQSTSVHIYLDRKIIISISIHVNWDGLECSQIRSEKEIAKGGKWNGSDEGEWMRVLLTK